MINIPVKNPIFIYSLIVCVCNTITVSYNARGGDIYRYFAGKLQPPLFPNNGLVEQNSVVAHPHRMYPH
jgi:hypothetical protein